MTVPGLYNKIFLCRMKIIVYFPIKALDLSWKTDKEIAGEKEGNR